MNESTRMIQDLMSRVARARAIVNRGLVRATCPQCVQENDGHRCDEDSDDDVECHCPDAVSWLCACFRDMPCGNPDCIGTQLWQCLNGREVPDLVGLLRRCLPVVVNKPGPGGLEDEIRALLSTVDSPSNPVAADPKEPQ